MISGSKMFFQVNQTGMLFEVSKFSYEKGEGLKVYPKFYHKIKFTLNTNIIK